MQLPQANVDVQSTAGFAKEWRYKGLAVPMDEIHIQFATDFANIVLRSFIQAVNQNLLALMASAPTQVAPEPTAPAPAPAAPAPSGIVLTGE